PDAVDALTRQAIAIIHGGPGHTVVACDAEARANPKHTQRIAEDVVDQIAWELPLFFGEMDKIPAVIARQPSTRRPKPDHPFRPFADGPHQIIEQAVLDVEMKKLFT